MQINTTIRSLTGELLHVGPELILSNLDLSYANLYGRRLSFTLMSGTNLLGADLFGANLRGADLSGADLSGADMRQADLRGAKLDNVKIDDDTRISSTTKISKKQLTYLLLLGLNYG